MARNVLVIKAANGSTLDAAVPLSVLSGKADGAISVTTRSFHGPRESPAHNGCSALRARR